MKTISRYIMTLALLITTAAGAWADSFSADAYTANATLNAVSVSTNQTVTINKGVTVTVNNGLTIQSNATLTITGGGTLVVNGATGANGNDGYVSPDPNTGDEVMVGPTSGGDGGAAITINGSAQLALSNATVIANGGQGGQGGQSQNGPVFWAASGANGNGFASFPAIEGAVLSYSTDNVTYTKYESGNTTLYRYMKVEPPTGPAVTIADGNGEASFKMPQYDVTASYTLKRDMSVDMPVTVQDAEQNSRFRVQKQNDIFVPVGLTDEQVMALFKVHDDIENKDLTAITDYTVQIFAADDNNQPTGTAMTFNDFTYAPGKYVVKAVAADGSNYDGETALSNVFTLFQGYEVEVPAGEYVTYYKDEALYVEDEDAQLYTITAVSGSTATADELTIAPANTPLLVKNNGATEKTIVLIPTTTNTPDNVTPYEGFKGTLEAKQIAASTTTQNNYAFNGKEFVWVKNDINIAANKAWLQVSAASAAPQIRLIFSSTTGIESVDREQSTVDDWYDLNGRRLPGKPTKKGVYIVNGKKMVVK